jgi:phosphomannomutase
VTPDELARRWRDADPDPSTRRRIDELLARDDPDELAELFGHRLHFGTAGLRAPLGPGPARMNRLVVRRAAAAVARHLLDQRHHPQRDRPPLVVVGHDARHGSAVFGDDLVEVLRDAGVDVARFDEAVPTPLVAAAVTTCGADAGLMVTASHNPAADNGLKLYGADGAQIVPPTDEHIARILDEMALTPFDPEAVDGIGPARAGAAGPGSLRHLGGPTLGGEVVAGYLDRAVGLLSEPAMAGRTCLPAPLRVVHTSLHGVGDALLRAALDRVDGVRATAVEDQQRPDPDFPTVTSPNPEDSTAVALLLAEAAHIGADVALALDPDADRLALALPAPGDPNDWQQLSGDQVGALLAAHLLERTTGADRLITTTVVSSQLVPAMCEAAGVHHVETLTGFKWLCRPGLAHPELRQLMAYEEALGYAVGADARDKDGITAALVVLDALATWRHEGRSAWEMLDELARRHGAHVTCNGAVQVSSDDALRALHTNWQDAGPRQLGGRTVVRGDRPDDDVWRWWLDDGTRVVVRPSGTEPKVKYYLEAIEAVGDDPAAARAAARARLDPVLRDVRALVTRSGG